MNTEQKLSWLQDVEVFAQVERGTLERMANALATREVPAGDFLFREGDPGGFVFLVAEGSLEAWKRDDAETEIFLRLMNPGEMGGLTSTVLGRTRSASLRARRPTVVLTIEAERFQEFLNQHPDLVRSVLAYLGDKVRDKTARMAGLLSRNQGGRGEPLAVFDAKPYDRTFFDEQAGDDLSPHYFETRLRPETAGLAAGFRAVCAFVNDELDAVTLERLAAGGVELLALRCAGFNNVDLAAAHSHGITVVRVPGYSPHAVAEHAVALILALNRKTHRAYQRVRDGNFSLDGLVGFDLHGRTAGIIGAGTIGRVLAGILGGFGMEVVAHDPFADREWAQKAGVSLLELDELLQRSDVVNLNAPLTPETHHMINASAIERMKPGVMLINTGRGALIDTTALVDGLKSGRVGAAGLDVYEEESDYFFEDRSNQVIGDDVLARLLTFPNVLVTSHQAFLTEDALRNIAETTALNVRAFLAGKRGGELVNVVEPPGEQAGTPS